MAKKKAASVNKSAEIRAYMKEHPKAKPAQVAAAFKERGIKVTPGYVSSIKTASKKRRGKGKAKAKAKRAAAAPKSKAAGTTAVQDMMSAGELMYQAVDLVMKAGFKEAKSLVEVAGKMVSKIRG